MQAVERRALYQGFLPDGDERAFVWKYAESIGGRRPPHFHGEPELNVVVRGSATFAVGRGLVQVSRGELLAFPAGQDHALLEATPDLYLYAIGLAPSFSAEVLGARGDTVVPLHAKLEPADLEAVVDRAAAIVDRSNVHQLGAELWERANWLARRATLHDGRGVHVLTRRALKRLETEPELGLEALANELRTHPSEISRHFHRDLGTTFVRHRTRLRMLKVIRLVDSGEDELMNAATAAGFGSYSQCHRAFHSELDCAPSEFFFSGLREEIQRKYAR
jgi:AraC-like DNA-binding protein/quercetin dioxygenase-like cupin family protein